MKKNLLEIILRAIETDLLFQKTIADEKKDFTPKLHSYNFELIWEVVNDKPLSDVFNDEDLRAVKNYLNRRTSEFDGNLNNMTIHDIRCSGFAIANIVLKNPYLEKFSYNQTEEAFELIGE